MELYNLSNPMEEMLARKADVTFSPLGGTMELLPLCNMNCKMCYIRQTSEEMKAQGRMLTCDEWLRIAEDAKRNGVLYLLISGGEPLIYPEFERLYTALTEMGFVITLNTNGTLIDEKWADLFGKYPCRRINITLYGADNETYGRLCSNPNGFSQVMRGARLLYERNVPLRFNCSVTPDNWKQLPRLYEIARDFNAPMEGCSYMFPPTQRRDNAPDFVRLTPAEAALSMLDTYKGKYPDVALRVAAENTLAKMACPMDISGLGENGFLCRAGRSGFWMNWKGEMLPCGMFEEPKISLLEHSFRDCWIHIVRQTQMMTRCKECDVCDKRDICKTCAAACLTETGKVSGKPEYLCEMTEEMVRICKEILQTDKETE